MPARPTDKPTLVGAAARWWRLTLLGPPATEREATESTVSLRLELLRILAPLCILAFYSGRLAHADEWLGVVGFHVPDLGVPDFRQPFYLAPVPVWAAWSLASLLVASGLALAVGFRARVAAPIFACLLCYVALADRLAAFTVSKLAPAVALALCFSRAGARLGVDSLLARRAHPAQLPPTLSVEIDEPGPIRFIQLLLVTLYFASGICKLRGDWLEHPLVLFTQLHNSYQTPLAHWLAGALPASIWTALQWLVLLFEAGAPLWFGLRYTRGVAFVIAVGMHVMIGLLFGPVRWFALLMIALLIADYAPKRILARLIVTAPCSSATGSSGAG